MVRIFVTDIDAEVIKIARQLGKVKQEDVMIETHDQYIEIHFKQE